MVTYIGDEDFSEDDDYFEIEVGDGGEGGFPIVWAGQTFEKIYVGTNSYITFGGPSEDYGSKTHPLELERTAIIVRSADNSCQRIGVLSTEDEYRIRFEGSYGTSGTLGEPDLLWEIVFYRDLPNVADIIVIEDAVPPDEGSTGISFNSEWVIERDEPFTVGQGYRLTYAGPTSSVGNSDFTSVLLRQARFDSAEDGHLIGYWKMAGNTYDDVAKDYSRNGFDAVWRGGMGQRSAIHDGLNGLQLSYDDYFYVPFNELMNTPEFTIGFAVTFSTGYDYVRLRLVGTYDDEEIEKLRISFGPGVQNIAAINASDTQVYDINFDKDIKCDAGSRIMVICRFNADGFKVNVNEYKYEHPVTSLQLDSLVYSFTSGAFVEMESGVTAQNAGIVLEGGVDSPILSHLFFIDESIDDSDCNALIGAAGVFPTIRDRNTKNISHLTDLEDVIEDMSNESDGVYFPLDGNICPFVDEKNSSRYLLGSPNDFDREPLIPDGRRYPHYNDSVDLYMSEIYNDLFADTSFSMGIVFKKFDADSGIAFDIKAPAGEDYYYRASLRLFEDRIYAEVFNTAGEEFLAVDYTADVVSGDSVIAIMTFNNDDTLTLFVNGSTVSVTGGTGTAVTTVDGEFNATDSFLYLNASDCTIGHVFFMTQGLELSQMMRMYKETGFKSIGMGVSGAVTVGDKILTLIDGRIIGIADV